MGPDLSETVRRFAVGALLLLPVAAAGQDQPPRFRSGVDVTSVEVTVVDDRGRPILGLDPDDFVVKVDGEARRVVSTDWVPLTQPMRRNRLRHLPATPRTRAAAADA